MNHAQKDNLFYRAEKGDVTILKDRNVARIKDHEGNTPLHYLAAITPEALSHHEAAYVRNDNGETPLHTAARNGFMEVENYTPCMFVRDKYDVTPFTYLEAYKQLAPTLSTTPKKFVVFSDYSEDATVRQVIGIREVKKATHTHPGEIATYKSHFSNAFNEAVALESIPDEMKVMNIPSELLIQFARTVAYKTFHNLRNGFPMSIEDDPLTVDGKPAPEVWPYHYEPHIHRSINNGSKTS